MGVLLKNLLLWYNDLNNSWSEFGEVMGED